MLSIVIPVYNQHDMTTQAILEILEKTRDFELVIVDNGSTPPYKPPFTGFNDAVLIRNEENRGFPVAVNQGIRASRGDVICLLNNDVFVTPKWAELMQAWLDEFDIVGPATNYCAGLQRATIGGYESIGELDREASIWSEENRDHGVFAGFVIGFCMMFRRSLFDEIGEFDEGLWPCSGEEIDFCFRAIEAGHKIGIAFDVYVHHEGSKTFQAMQESGESDYEEICRKCDERLAERWGAGFWQKQIIEMEENEEE